MGYYQTGEDRLRAMRDTGRVYPEGQEARIVSAVVTVPSPRVAEQLGLEPGSSVIARRRVTTEAGVILAVSTSFFDALFAEVAPKLLVSQRLPEGTLAYLESVIAERAVTCRDELWAAVADGWPAEELGVEEGSPVLMGRTWWAARSGRVLEFGESVALPGLRKVFRRSVAV